MPVFLGIDGGGTQTRALAIDGWGEVVHAGEGGPSNLATLDDDAILRSLVDAVRGCPRPDIVCGCFAGVVSDSGRQRAENLLRKWLPDARIEVRPDFHAALAAADEGTTCAVIAGTGSVVASFIRNEVVKSGGGGPLLGDQGSAFAVGRRMLQVLLSGRPTPDEVTVAFDENFATRDLGEIVSHIYSDTTPALRVAGLAPAVAEAALAGNADAEWCVAHEMGLLAELTVDHVLRFHADIEQPHIALAGGLWKASKVFEKEFDNALKASAGILGNSELGDAPARRFIIDRLREPPVSGAVKLARRLNDEH